MKTLFQNNFCKITLEGKVENQNYFALYRKFNVSDNNANSESFIGISEEIKKLRFKALYEASFLNNAEGYNDSFYAEFVIRPVQKANVKPKEFKPSVVYAEVVFHENNLTLLEEYLMNYDGSKDIFILSVVNNGEDNENIFYSPKEKTIIAADNDISSLEDYAIMELGAKAACFEKEYKDNIQIKPVVYLIEAIKSI